MNDRNDIIGFAGRVSAIFAPFKPPAWMRHVFRLAPDRDRMPSPPAVEPVELDRFADDGGPACDVEREGPSMIATPLAFTATTPKAARSADVTLEQLTAMIEALPVFPRFDASRCMRCKELFNTFKGGTAKLSIQIASGPGFFSPPLGYLCSGCGEILEAGLRKRGIIK